MFLLDTNVVSELRKAGSGNAEPGLVRWIGSAAPESLYLSAITIFELERGAALKARRDPRQGSMLQVWLRVHVMPAFEDRILAVDASVARCCAGLHVPNPMSERDSFIAATAIVHGMTVVTRNLRDFRHRDVAVLDPVAG